MMIFVHRYVYMYVTWASLPVLQAWTRTPWSPPPIIAQPYIYYRVPHLLFIYYQNLYTNLTIAGSISEFLVLGDARGLLEVLVLIS